MSFVVPKGCEHHRLNVKGDVIVCMACGRELPRVVDDSSVTYELPPIVPMQKFNAEHERLLKQLDEPLPKITLTDETVTVDDRDVSDAQDAEAVADEWMNHGRD